jgi:uncharacterized membrane protein YgaE (UPF0421/DUF939 family)
MLATAKDTIKISFVRLVSYIVTAVAAAIAFYFFKSEWLAYGVYIFITLFFAEMMGWQAALAANVVAGTHFFSIDVFAFDVVINEFYIICLGQLVALILNTMRNTDEQEVQLRTAIRDIQGRMQGLLLDTIDYIESDGQNKQIWPELKETMELLDHYILKSAEYEGNKFEGDAGYFLRYFEMRRNQLMVIRNLHGELSRMKEMPVQAQVIATYIAYMSEYVTELNVPTKQLEYMDELFKQMANEPLPVTRSEFENRACLYHVLMDLEDFLIIKKRYLEEEEKYQKNLREIEEWKKNYVDLHD